MAKVIDLTTRPTRPHRYPVPATGTEPALGLLIKPDRRRTRWYPAGFCSLAQAAAILDSSVEVLARMIIEERLRAYDFEGGLVLLDTDDVASMRTRKDRLADLAAQAQSV